MQIMATENHMTAGKESAHAALQTTGIFRLRIGMGIHTGS